jgi:DNA-directed RNA polymerase alpha subunit
MPVTRVNYLIQASDDLQLAKDYIILEVWTNGVFIRAMQFTKRLKH